jgi:hypothetical protein
MFIIAERDRQLAEWERTICLEADRLDKADETAAEKSRLHNKIAEIETKIAAGSEKRSRALVMRETEDPDQFVAADTAAKSAVTALESLNDLRGKIQSDRAKLVAASAATKKHELEKIAADVRDSARWVRDQAPSRFIREPLHVVVGEFLASHEVLLRDRAATWVTKYL